jgi:hypothetical protein
MTGRESRPTDTEAAPNTTSQVDTAQCNSSTDAKTVSALSDYLTACFADGAGQLIVATGGEPHLTDEGRYKHNYWHETNLGWPSEAAKAHILDAATTHDVYVCHYLMRDKHRRKGNAVTHALVHSDVDNGALDTGKVSQLGGFAIASGTPGNGHAYVPLSESVSAQQHEVLCRALGHYLGAADAKISDNDLLRPPGTLNHKPAVDGGDPSPVRWLVPYDGTRVDPETLAVQLNVSLNAMASPRGADSPVAKKNGKASTSTEPLDLDGYPDVAAVIGRDTGDRSADTARIVGACVDASLTLAQTRWCVAQHAGAAQRLDGRRDDDVLALWIKFTDDRNSRVGRFVGNPSAATGAE